MKDQLKREIASFENAMSEFPWASKWAYADWLSQTNHFVAETTTLLTLAATKSERNSKLQLRFIEHAAEEKGHDKLLLMDLKSLGENVHNYPELPATASLYQPQYFWLNQRDPRSFFGYIILLEGVAAVHGPRSCELAQAAHGKSATHFMRVHSAEDTEHLEKAFDEISKFPTDAAEMAMRNFLNSASAYRLMLDSIIKRAQSTHSKAA